MREPSFNPLLATDGYKLTHWSQIPDNVTKEYSYFESRGGMFPYTMAFGMQRVIKRTFTTPFTQDHIYEAADFAGRYFNSSKVFNREGFEYILKEHGGFFPFKIKAVPEGTIVPYKNALFTVESTDPKAAWITHPVETALMRLWAPITVGTNALYMMKDIRDSLIRTGGDLSRLTSKVTDFGSRGVSSDETAIMCGAAFLAAGWESSDNVEAIKMIVDDYNWRKSEGWPAYSIPASEHAVALLYGKEGEKEYVMNILRKHFNLPVSIVGDTWNIYKFLEMCSTDSDIRELILSRPAPTIFRLDSGDPVEVILKSLNILWNNFGGSYTDNHFKVLHPKVLILQGDGIGRLSVRDNIIPALEANKWSLDVFGTLGSGGKLLQMFGRDDNEFAIKNSFAIKDGIEMNLFKDPITSSGKRSKPGMLKLHPQGKCDFMTLSSANTPFQDWNSYADALVPVFENGKLLYEEDFHTIRKRSAKFLEI